MLEKTELEKLFAGIDFGNEFDNLKQRLHEFNEALTKLKSTVNDPDYYISEHFLDLRNQIDLERELCKKQIDDHYDKRTLIN